MKFLCVIYAHMCVNGNTANEHVMQNQGTGLDASIPKVKIHYNHKTVYIYKVYVQLFDSFENVCICCIFMNNRWHYRKE